MPMPARAAAKEKVAKLRRTHRKSRNGCLECKRRHIKCDEARPACSNCVVGERQCSFPAPGPGPASSNGASATAGAGAGAGASVHGHGHSHSPAADSTTSSTPRDAPGSRPSPSLGAPTPPVLPSFNESFARTPQLPLPSVLPLPPPPSSLGPSTFTAEHLGLLHHASSSMDALSAGVGVMQPIIDIAVKHAVDCPYTIDQLLSVSADHMALCNPAQAAAYRHIGTELQTRALSSFNREAQDIPEDLAEAKCVPRFLFASLLSLHMLYVSFSLYRDNFHIFIERFIEATNLHRGVRTMISSTYHIITESPLRPFILMIRDAENNRQGTECNELMDLIESSDLGPATVAGCRKAVETLQWAFNIHANLPSTQQAHAASAYSVLLNPEFVDALRKHRPEALIILAHYGIIVHRCRSSWIFGDGGAFMIRLIADYLGHFWQSALRWPLEVIETEVG